MNMYLVCLVFETALQSISESTGISDICYQDAFVHPHCHICTSFGLQSRYIINSTRNANVLILYIQYTIYYNIPNVCIS